MKELTHSQLAFIKKEYEFLSKCCKESFDSGNSRQLAINRRGLSSFVRTIEGLFDLDFNVDIKPKIS